MKIVVFGATRGTGRHVIEQALARGHCVTAAARRPDAITVQHAHLRVLQGDVMETATLAPAVCDQDAVISTIGVEAFKPTTLYSDGIVNILHAMGKAGVRRLICVSSSALETGPDIPLYQRILIPLILRRVFRHVYADMTRMESILDASDLDWTIVRAPRLTNGPKRGTYRIGVNRRLSQVGVSRADLADCILMHLEDATTYGKRLELAY